MTWAFVCITGKSLDIYMFYGKLIKSIWINRQKISEELILISIATLKELKNFVSKKVIGKLHKSFIVNLKN